jgi:hypothetical protein
MSTGDAMKVLYVELFFDHPATAKNSWVEDPIPVTAELFTFLSTLADCRGTANHKRVQILSLCELCTFTKSKSLLKFKSILKVLLI